MHFCCYCYSLIPSFLTITPTHEEPMVSSNYTHSKKNIVSNKYAHARGTYCFLQSRLLGKNLLFLTITPTREEPIVSNNNAHSGRTYCFLQTRPLRKNLLFLIITPTWEEPIISNNHAHSGRTYCFLPAPHSERTYFF